MAFITLQQMYDAWKRVADWVSGANTDKPPVRVTDGTDTLAINPDGSLPVQLTGSRVVEETVLNAVSIAPGSYQVFNINPTNEDEIWFLVSVDKTPWTIMTSSQAYGGADGANRTIFPVRHNQNTTHTITTPCVSLFLGGINVDPLWGLTEVTSISEARQFMIPYKSNAVARIGIGAGASGTATVTVKLLRVWKNGGRR